MSKYKGVAFLSELKAAEAGTYDGRNIEDLGFTLQEVIDFGKNGTLEEHGVGISDYFVMYVPDEDGSNERFEMQIAGIDHGWRTTDQDIGFHHIDWISRNLANKLVVWNKSNFNNGRADMPCPYMCSNIKFYLNAEAGTCGDGSVVDYTSVGFLARLATSTDANAQTFYNNLRTKRALLETRYSSSGTLSNNNSWDWKDMGKLWLPTEVEIFGRSCWSEAGYGNAYNNQYPIFRNFKHITKCRTAGDRYDWWSASVHAGSSTYACNVNGNGNAHCYDTSSLWVGFAVCGRT